jgi:transcriptional regulator
MYTPAHFQEDRLPVLHDAIRCARLAALVTIGSDGLEASHVPIMLDALDGAFGSLHGHIARANPQWRRHSATVPALAIFPGPEAYVSPSWYASKAETGKVVPTWNYVAVHAGGTIEFYDDRARLLALVAKLTDLHEGRRTEPWAVSDAPADYIEKQLQGIVGFKLVIARLEGKWKVSQNRSMADRQGVIAGLGREGDAAERTLADVMLKMLE